MKVVLDTNFLMISGQFKINIYEEIRKNIPDAEMITSKEVLDELQMIDNKDSKLAEKIFEKEKIKILELGKPVDDKLLEFSYKNKVILCTNDKELRNKALKKGVTVMFMRGKNKIDMKRP